MLIVCCLLQRGFKIVYMIIIFIYIFLSRKLNIQLRMYVILFKLVCSLFVGVTIISVWLTWNTFNRLTCCGSIKTPKYLFWLCRYYVCTVQYLWMIWLWIHDIMYFFRAERNEFQLSRMKRFHILLIHSK